MFQRVAVALTLVLTLASGSALSQEAGTRSGFWLSFGGGGGVMNGLRGASFYVRMGGTPNEQACPSSAMRAPSPFSAGSPKIPIAAIPKSEHLTRSSS